MRGYIKKCSDIIDWIYRFAAVAFLVLLVISCCFQVFTRYVLNASMLWTEEVARYCFIWVNMLGAAILAKSKKHVVIDFFVKNLEGATKRIHLNVVSVTILAIAGILIYQSFLLLPVVAQQISPATNISMFYVYMAIPVGGVGIFINELSSLLSPDPDNMKKRGDV